MFIGRTLHGVTTTDLNDKNCTVEIKRINCTCLISGTECLEWSIRMLMVREPHLLVFTDSEIQRHRNDLNTILTEEQKTTEREEQKTTRNSGTTVLIFFLMNNQSC